MAIYGYVRQRAPLPLNDQLKIVSDYDCETIFIESFKRKGQPDEFKRMTNQLIPGDMVVIASVHVFGEDFKTIKRRLAYLQKKQVVVMSWSNQLCLNYYRMC